VLDTTHVTRLASHARLWVGLSGGLDSIVLLHALSCEPALAPKLHAVHVHHGLSSHADAWQEHCEQVCAGLALPLLIQHAYLDKTQSNLEETARNARFDIFEACIQPKDCLVLAHHQNDQTETLLLRLLRGTGVDGLGAMKSYRTFGCGHIARPLLDTRKQAIEAYAHTHGLVWVEDDSNQTLKFSRNYLRHEIVPRLKNAWPCAIESISACAEHCQEAQANLDDLAYLDCPDLALKQPHLSLAVLPDLPVRRLKLVLRVWLKNQGLKALSAVQLDVLMQDVLYARPDAMPVMRVGDVTIRRYRDVLYVVRDLQAPKLFAVPALPHVRVPKGAHVEVRYRTGGETMVLHGQTKRLKSLFQHWGIPPWERDTIPLIFIENKLAAVLNFAIGDDYYEPNIV